MQMDTEARALVRQLITALSPLRDVRLMPADVLQPNDTPLSHTIVSTLGEIKAGRAAIAKAMAALEATAT